MLVGAESSKFILVTIALAAGLAITACSSRYANLPGAYEGRPFEDHHYMGGPQVIPGCVQAAYFDLGGEGIAYHDTDKVKSSCSRCITTKATTWPGLILFWRTQQAHPPKDESTNHYQKGISAKLRLDAAA
jgi:hypothetical protein